MGKRGNRKEGIKSALELAMERLEERGEVPKNLSEGQKTALRKVEEALQARIAEEEIMTAQQVVEAEAAGNVERIQELKSGKTAEIGRLRRSAEKEKEKIRSGKG